MMTMAQLRAEIGGAVLEPGDDGYDEARRVWNGMIDRRPTAVVRAGGIADIAPTIRLARELGLPLAIRGGGHNVAGNGTVEGGIVLDLGGLNAVEVDPEAREVRVAAGATLGDLDRATEPHGLAVAAGVVSGTGVAGLTLGGGVGWLTRAYGISVDNLLGVDLVTAAGKYVHASATENAELFWGVRGGGGNFGVVTSFTFRAYPLGPDILAGAFVYRASSMTEALRGWGAWSADAPDAMTTIATVLVPPADFEMGDDPIMFLGWLWASDDRTEGERAVDRLRRAAPPDDEIIEPTSWTAWQSQFDAVLPKGVRAYWKNTSFERLDDATIEVITHRATEQTWRGTAFDIHHMEGAFGRVPEDATPFPNRSARYWLNIYGFWPDAADDPARIAFVRGFAADMEPHASGGQYVNFLGQEGGHGDPRAAALAVYGPAKLARLTALKRRYDPDNTFRLNHNIPPD
jgi:FAD/FMN-containing dehydrogenase